MKEWKTSTLRMTKPRKLCRARLVLDMLVPGLRRAPYSRRSGNHCPPSRKHTPCFAVPTTSTLGWGCGSDFRAQSELSSNPNGLVEQLEFVAGRGREADSQPQDRAVILP